VEPDGVALEGGGERAPLRRELHGGVPLPAVLDEVEGQLRRRLAPSRPRLARLGGAGRGAHLRRAGPGGRVDERRAGEKK
jgi:hypothetical protein